MQKAKLSSSPTILTGRSGPLHRRPLDNSWGRAGRTGRVTPEWNIAYRIMPPLSDSRVVAWGGNEAL
jgi:hypothetical protein